MTVRIEGEKVCIVNRNPVNVAEAIVKYQEDLQRQRPSGMYTPDNLRQAQANLLALLEGETRGVEGLIDPPAKSAYTELLIGYAIKPAETCFRLEREGMRYLEPVIATAEEVELVAERLTYLARAGETIKLYQKIRGRLGRLF